MKLKLLVLSLLLSNSINAATLTSEVTAHAHQAIGFKGQDIYLVCDHSAKVTNNTGVMQPVHVNYQICADNKDCTTRRYKINVGNDTWSASTNTRITTIYNHPGHYRLVCKTWVDGLASQEDVNDIGIN